MKLFSTSALSHSFLAVFLFILVPTISSLDVARRNPVLALVPAAWHTPIHYVEYIRLLNSAGFKTVIQKLPSTGSESPEAQSVAADARFIRQNLLMPSIDAGFEVVLIMHSYSGGPGAVAAKGLSLAERRAAGKPGGIIGLIFIAAFIAEEGQTLLSSSGGKFAPWVIEHKNGQLSVKDAENVFFNGVPTLKAESAAISLEYQSRHSAETPCGPPAWADDFYHGRRTYVLCTQDVAIPPVAQQHMMTRSGVEWNTKYFQTGHAPFLSKPQELTTFTTSEIEKFRTAGSGILKVGGGNWTATS